MTLCNNCAGKVVLSLNEHVTQKGLVFCCPQCADAFFSPENIDPYPFGLAHDMGVEE